MGRWMIVYLRYWRPSDADEYFYEYWYRHAWPSDMLYLLFLDNGMSLEP